MTEMGLLLGTHLERPFPSPSQVESADKFPLLAAQDPRDNFAKMRVTMVDDSAADRKLCRILLEGTYGQDLEFVEAATARAGLEACLTKPTTNGAQDCLLLDYKL